MGIPVTPHGHVDTHTPALRKAFLDAVAETHGDPRTLVDALRVRMTPPLRAILRSAYQDAAGAVRKDEADDGTAKALAALLAALSVMEGPTAAGRQVANRYIAQQGLAGQGATRLLDATAGLTDGQVRQVLAYRDGQAEDNPPGVVAQRVDALGLRLRVQRAGRAAEDQGVRASVAGQASWWDNAIAIGAIDPSKEGRRWTATHDHRVEAICAGLDGTVVPFGQPFPGGYMAPPDPHLACRCVLTLARLA